MMLEVTSEEVEILRNLIEERIAELGPEIHHTRTPDYHEALKELREKLKTLEGRLPQSRP